MIGHRVTGRVDAGSGDHGRTWELRESGAWRALTAHCEGDPNTVAVVDDRTRFFRSTDGGRLRPRP